MYYIISLKHTNREDKYITLWRPNNSGYCYVKEDAGIYNEIEEGYHNCEGDSLPIELEKLDQFFTDSDIIFDNQIKKCIPNCREVWDPLNLKMTNSGLQINNRDLSKNRGIIILDRKMLTDNPTENELKEIFSNFFPIAIENDHSYNLYQNLKMYGYSQHFRKIEEGEKCPEYVIYLIRDKNGTHFHKMVEQSQNIPK